MFTIEPLAEESFSKFNTIESQFTVSKVIDVQRTGFGPTLCIEPAGEYQRRSEPENLNASDYCNRSDRAAFLAHSYGDLTGQLILRRNWNNFAWIEDIVVHPDHRRSGIGTGLLGQAVSWAEERSLAGVMLETQNTNVPACRLYQRFGFEIGGYDRYLYRDTPYAGEVAMFWYFLIS